MPHPRILLWSLAIAFASLIQSPDFDAGRSPVGPPLSRHSLSSATVVSAAEPGPAWPKPPLPAYTVIGNVIDVYDGDTMTVEVKQQFKVRLLDCWAPEIHHKDPQVKKAGDRAGHALRSLCLGKEVILSVPWTEDFGSSLTFGRVLGHVWLENDKQSLSERQVKGGYATREKVE